MKHFPIRAALLAWSCVSLTAACGDGTLSGDDDEADRSERDPSEEGPLELGSEPDPNLLSQDLLFECDGPAVPSPARMRRIDNEEWAASIGRPGGDERFNPLTADPGHRFSTYASGETLDITTMERFIDFAPRSVVGWSGPSDCSCAPQPTGIGCMFEEGVPERSCIEHYASTYLRDFVLFREPLPGEVERLSDFSVSALEDGVAAGQERAVLMEKINAAAWLSTGGLFRSELARGPEVEPGVRQLSAEETGKMVAYALSDHGPGAPSSSSGVRIGSPALLDIREAVRAKSIMERETIEGIVAAHFGGIDDERSEFASEYWVSAKIGRFFREWLGTDAFRTSFHDDPQATSGLSDFTSGTCSSDSECETNWFCNDGGCTPYVNGSYSNSKGGLHGKELSLDAQLGEMVARIVVEDQDVFENLLTSRTFFIPSSETSDLKNTTALQFAYNVTSPVPSTREARWQELPAEERAGVLTHPAWLASHGSNFENGPSAVLRGKWIRENLLCGTVPDVPITVDANFSEDTIELSARERLAEATGKAECRGCHTLMNPLGLPFEIYNHAGFLRATDHDHSPEGSSVLEHTGFASLDVEVGDAPEMMELFAGDRDVRRCFLRQVFRFFAGRSEVEADACVLVAMEDAYERSGGSLRAVLAELLSSPALLHRTFDEQEVSE